MSQESLFLWVIFLLYLFPIFFTGFLIIRRITNIVRIEVLIPAAFIIGIGLFIFFLNITAFFIKPPENIILAYVSILLIAWMSKKKSIRILPIELFNKKWFILYLFSTAFWLLLIFWKANFALIGSDTNLYYSIAHSFIRGNFPPKTPWQPGIDLNYHIGAFEFLGSFHFLTNLSFEFLHVIFSSLFIFSASQIIIWFLKRHDNLVSFLLANLVSAIILVSFGFIKFIWPILPLQLLAINNLHSLFLWIRQLPTVNESIEVYGAPINLDALIYFIFHALGISLFLVLLLFVMNVKKERILFSLIIFLVGTASLSLINESIFAAVSVPLLAGFFLFNWNKIFFKANIFKIIFLIFLFFFIVIFQGGFISSFFTKNFSIRDNNQSIIVFPKKNEILGNFNTYHTDQSTSRILPQKKEWLPFTWIHVGLDILIYISTIILIFSSGKVKILTLTLFLSGIFSLFLYFNVVPKYIIANGNRFLSFSFLTLTLLIFINVINLIESLKNKFLIKFVLIFFILWFTIPTILPPLLLLSKNRVGEDKLAIKKEEIDPSLLWLKENVRFDTKVAVLDQRAPHPSGVAKVMIQSGVFSPIFPNDFKAYTIEASPEYLDIAYSLSPKALSKLDIDLVLIDSDFYKNLNSLRKKQLEDENLFQQLFYGKLDQNRWEKVFKIRPSYLNESELVGTIDELAKKVSSNSKIYVDNEENFQPPYLRRAIIFTIRNRNLYFLPQSGVYLNVETYINQKYPDSKIKYDYLLLGKNTNPESLCNCNAELTWKGLNDEVLLWKTNYL